MLIAALFCAGLPIARVAAAPVITADEPIAGLHRHGVSQFLGMPYASRRLALDAAAGERQMD